MKLWALRNVSEKFPWKPPIWLQVDPDRAVPTYGWDSHHLWLGYPERNVRDPEGTRNVSPA